MAIDPERLLISSVLHDGEITPVLDAKITEDFFNDDEHLQVWRWTLEHWTKHSKVPDQITLKRNFPAWKLAATPEPIGHYVDLIRERRKYEIVQDAVVRANAAVKDDDDVDAAIAALAVGVQEAYSQVSSLKDLVLTQEAKRYAKLYTERAKNPGALRGFSTGFDAIDRATRGFQPEQYVVIIGPPKSAKSTLLMDMGLTINEEHNARVLLVGFEMSVEEQNDRYMAMRAGVSLTRLSEGRLTAKEKRKLDRALEDEDDFEDFILSTDIAATTTISGLRAKVSQLKPDVLLVDGAYLMEDENGEPPGSPQALTNISRGLKRMAQATRVPIVVTTQALESKITRARGIESTSAGYTSAWGQDADVMMGAQRKPGFPDITELKVLLSRSGPLTHTELKIDWSTSSITEYEPPEEDDDDEDSETRRTENF